MDKSRASKKTMEKKFVELMGSSILGGMLGGYLEEGYPLYLVSSHMLQHLGYNSEEEFRSDIGGKIRSCVHPEDWERLESTIAEALQQGDRYEVKYRLRKKDRTYAFVQEHGMRVEAEDGRTVILGACVDITDTMRLQRELEEKNRELEAITDNMPGGTFRCLVDEEVTIDYVSDGFVRLIGYSREKIMEKTGGNFWRLVYPPDRARAKEEFGRAVDLCIWTRKEQRVDLEYRMQAGDGRLIWVLDSSRLILEAGSLYSYCAVSDITRRRQMEDQVRIDEERLRLALEQTNNIVFDYDVAARTIHQPAHSAKRYGLPKVVEGAPESLVENGTVLPDSAQDFLRMYRKLLSGASHASCVVRMRITDGGGEAWERISLSAIRNEDGQVIRAIGVTEDITLRKKLEQAYHKEEQYRTAMLADALTYYEINLTTDQVENVKGMWHPSLPQPDNLSYSRLVRELYQKVISPDTREEYWALVSPEALMTSFHRGVTELRCEHRRLNAAGMYQWMLVTVHLLEDPETRELKGFTYLRNIDRQKREELALKYRSQYDLMTRLYNKVTAEEKIQEVLSSSEQDSVHAVIIVDIDNFKAVNDTFGHMAGDQILTDAAQKISAIFRSDDIVGRIGGDEFIILVKNVGGAKALVEEKAEAICRILRQCSVGKMTATGSVGVSFYPTDGRSFDALYQAADIALYETKKRGRDGFTFYSADMDSERWKPYSSSAIENGAPRGMSREAAEGGAQLLNEMNDIVYVSDPVTYELLYINSVVAGMIEEQPDRALRKPCYRVLQNRESPCPFCTNHLLSFDEHYIWEFTNPYFNRHYIIKDKLVMWNGRPARMEFAMDVSERENVSQELAAKLEMENRLVGCIKALFEARDLEESVRLALESIGEFYRADRAYVLEFSPQDNIICKIHEWCASGVVPQRSAMEGKDITSYTCLRNIVEKKLPVRILCREDFEQYPREHELFRAMGTESLYAVPFVVEEGLKGYIGVENASLHKGDITFLESLGYFVIGEIKKRRLYDALQTANLHDLLTGLPNRNSYQQFRRELQKSPPKNVGVLMADINGLKQINESRGARIGDMTVKEVAQSLCRAFPEDSVFHMGSDEFLMISVGRSRIDFINAIQQAREELAVLENCDVAMGYTWSESGADIQELVTHADQRMLLEKQKHYENTGGKGTRYSPTIFKELIEAIEGNCFQIYLQAKTDIATGQAVGAEALVRYVDTEYGVVSPIRFIPLLERTRLIRYVDFFVLEKVCETLTRWREAGWRILPVSLNFSRITLLESDILETLCRICDSYNIPHQWIEIEITETAGEMEREIVAEIGGNIKSKGFRLSLDDFGSEYSSMSMLAAIEFDTLKMDRSLLLDLEKNTRCRAVLECVGGMCRSMKIAVIAEGVETREQLDALRRVGCCDQVQGYFYCRPLPREDFEERYIAAGR